MNAMTKTTSVALMGWAMTMGMTAAVMAGPLPKDELNKRMDAAKAELVHIDRVIANARIDLQKARQDYIDTMGMFGATGKGEYYQASRDAVARTRRISDVIARAEQRKVEVEQDIEWLQMQLDQWAEMDAAAAKPKPSGTGPTSSVAPRPGPGAWPT